MDYAQLAVGFPNFISDHIEAIHLISGMTSAMIALVMFLPRYNALTVGDWVKYFSFGFALIAGQYFVHVIIKATVPSFQETYPYHLLWAIGSAANSVFFLAAAISLLGRTHLFPRQVLIFACFAALAASVDEWALQYPLLSWVRLPDALLSAFCLGAAGITIGSNISFYWRKGLASIAISVALMYAVLLLIYGFHPILAQTSPVNSWVGPTDQQIQNIEKNERQSESTPRSREDIRKAETLDRLDALAFTISLPLKLGLFIPAYILLIFILKTSEQSDQLLDRLGRERLSYLSGPGIVQLVGEQLKADKVELSFLVPGPSRRIASFHWNYGEMDEEFAKVKQLDDDPALASVMEDGKVRRRLAVKSPATAQFITEDELGFKYSHLRARPNAVLVPIKYNGAVVGCLRIEQDNSKTFIETAIQQAKAFARLLTLLAQPYRYLATLDQISYRCARLQVEHNIKDSEEAVMELVKIIDEILSPLATGMFLKIGFKQQKQVIGNHSYYKALIHERWEGPHDPRNSIELMRIPFTFTENYEPLETYEAPLITNLSDEAQFFTETQSNKKEGPRLGNFILVARADKDEINKPTLGMFYLHRKVISSILSDAILDLARDVHSESLKQFSLAVSQDAGVEKWFEALEKSAQAAELLWAVSLDAFVESKQEPGSLGEEELVVLVRQVIQKHKRKIEADVEGTGIALVQLDVTSHQANSVIFLRLPRTGQLISFGIERPKFGVELDFDSPWKAFLLALRDLADSALDKIMGDMEFRSIQIEASQNQALATVAATTGTIIHQLVNMTRDQMSGSAALRSALRTGNLQTEDERLKRIIQNMSESGKSMLELTQSITNITKVDDTRPCNLSRAVEHARDLFSISVVQNGIDFKSQVDPTLMIDVPYYVAALALANLVSNAKDALKSGIKRAEHPDKRIQVLAEETKDEEGNEWVFCHVMDTGPGISEINREKVFHLGFSTKLNSGGWGLYLVKRALRENNSDIALAHPGPKNTTFSMKFPKAYRNRNR